MIIFAEKNERSERFIVILHETVKFLWKQEKCVRVQTSGYFHCTTNHGGSTIVVSSLLLSTAETGATVRAAIKVLKEHGVRETQIVFINLFASYDGKNY